MKERPILFSGQTVLAILDERKTQTRRPVRVSGAQPKMIFPILGNDDVPTGEWFFSHHQFEHVGVSGKYCPHGKPGDRLWVRETFRSFSHANECDHVDDCGCPPSGTPVYRADCDAPDEDKWTPSIHMPRWASRINLEIIGVRVERLQDISQEDAIAEGAPLSHPSIDQVSREFGYPDFSRSWFAQLWDLIYGKDATKTWVANPWVWVTEFRRISQ